jgi:hypothetical protein
MRVRAKVALLTIQVLFLAMILDFLQRLWMTSWHPSDEVRFFVFRIACLLVAILAVDTARANTLSYRRLRMEDKSN